jgi:peptide-methionine (S)-S-oxide reductase
VIPQQSHFVFGELHHALRCYDVMNTPTTIMLALALMTTSMDSVAQTPSQKDTATFGAGCFWCVEAVFERLPGVVSVTAGYTGGHRVNPTYEQVCTGTTGHAEVAQIVFDPSTISFEKLLNVFWEAHDPTTMNRQGADAGTQYRSAIFYHSDRQKAIAEQSRTEARKGFKDPIVTEITPLTVFYTAENYHQDYFRNNPTAPYCKFVIEPKLKKLKMP